MLHAVASKPSMTFMHAIPVDATVQALQLTHSRQQRPHSHSQQPQGQHCSRPSPPSTSPGSGRPLPNPQLGPLLHSQALAKATDWVPANVSAWTRSCSTSLGLHPSLPRARAQMLPQAADQRYHASSGARSAQVSIPREVQKRPLLGQSLLPSPRASRLGQSQGRAQPGTAGRSPESQDSQRSRCRGPCKGLGAVQK